MTSRISRQLFAFVRPLALLSVTAAVLAGCVGGAGVSSSSPEGSGSLASPSASSAAGGFYLRAWQSQALAPQYTFGGLPVATIAGGRFIDGMVAIPEMYPGPTYVGLSGRPISAAGIDAIVAEARKDGLLGDKSTFADGVMPGSITAHVHLVVAGVAYDLSGSLPADASTSSTTPGTVDAFHAFWNRITSLNAWLAADLGQSSPYTPTSIAVMLTPPVAAPADFKVQETAWPLTGTLAAFGSPMGTAGYRCGVVSGADLDVLLPAVQASNQLTRFTDSTGAKVSLQVRVLVPGDEGPCA